MAAPGLACADKRTGNTQLIDNRWSDDQDCIFFDGFLKKKMYYTSFLCISHKKDEMLIHDTQEVNQL